MSYYANSQGKLKHPHIKHAVSRAKSRYGLSAPDVRRLEQMIQRREGIVRSQRQSNSRTLHEIEMNGQRYFAVYAKSTNHLVTLLSPEMGRRHFGEVEARCCICDALLAPVGKRMVCTIHPGIAQ